MAILVVYSTTISIILSIFILSCNSQSTTIPTKVPALYVFGDSLVDVGNNDYLKLSLAKANFPHNGVDFPGQKATGRFSNGRNSADFLAEKTGFATSQPPYLSLALSKSKLEKSNGFPITGVSFASGGAGIFNGTDDSLKQSVPLTKQVDHYSAVYEDLVQRLGSAAAEAHLSKSLFVIVIGSNDLLGYFKKGSDDAKNATPQQFVDSMISAFKLALKQMHNLGARKFVVTGVATIGCCPSQRNQNKTGECNEEANQWSAYYNQALKSMLQSLKVELKNAISYSYADTYSIFANFVQTPATYGFTEIKSACCGLGNLRAQVPCIPISQYCSNRTSHLFWDLYHPTEAAARIIIDTLFDGPPRYSTPMNVKELIAT